MNEKEDAREWETKKERQESKKSHKRNVIRDQEDNKMKDAA